jgi:hypothetical protein
LLPSIHPSTAPGHASGAGRHFPYCNPTGSRPLGSLTSTQPLPSPEGSPTRLGPPWARSVASGCLSLGPRDRACLPVGEAACPSGRVLAARALAQPSRTGDSTHVRPPGIAHTDLRKLHWLPGYLRVVWVSATGYLRVVWVSGVGERPTSLKRNRHPNDAAWVSAQREPSHHVKPFHARPHARVSALPTAI